MRLADVVGTLSAGVSSLAVPVPDPVFQAIIAVVAAVIGWLTTLVGNYIVGLIKKALGR